MHRTSSLPALALWAFGAAATAAASSLSVSFVRPEKYADAAYSSAVGSERERAEVQRDIDHHLKQLAERHLAPGRSLEIEVLDVDLAGRFEPFRFRSGADVRIVRDVTRPRMRMRYALTEGGQVTSSSEETCGRSELPDVDQPLFERRSAPVREGHAR